MAELFGRVLSVSFNEGSYYVFSFEVDETVPKRPLASVGRVAKVRGHVYGIIQLWQGVPLHLIGDWKKHPKYGLQFQFHAWQPWARDERGVSCFLYQCVDGFLNASFTNALVKEHGLKLYEVLTNEPDKVRELAKDPTVCPGVDLTDSAERGLDSWAAINATYALSTLLEDVEFSADMIRAVISEFGSDAAKIIEQNPYGLLRVEGFRFSRVDGLAFRMGLSRGSEARFEGAVLWVLREAVQNGHLCVRRGDIAGTLMDLMKAQDVPPLELERGKDLSTELMAAVDRMVSQGTLVLEPDVGVYLAKYHKFERGSADRLAEFLGPVQLNVDVPSFIKDYELANNVTLSDAQREAVEKLVTNKVLVLTGLPGTGKTTVVKTFVEMFKRAGINMLLLAPTGIAAKRMASVTGHEASTIHRAFRYDTKTWGYDRSCQYLTGAVIVDETSMVDQELLYRTLEALHKDTILVFVGDDAQLPSVGPGNVLRELVNCPALPCVRLTQIFRQSEQSAIVLNSHRVNRGEALPLSDLGQDSDFRFVAVPDEDQIVELVVKFAGKLKSRDANFQVLAPKYEGTVGIDNLNMRIREVLNPDAGQKQARIGLLDVREGDRVMVIQNDYKLNVYNGDMGKLKAILPRYLAVCVYGAGGDGLDAIVNIPRERAATMLKLAYAVTVHRSQGCEFDTVIMPIVKGQGRMLQRNLLYTAITRAKQKVWLLGTEAALNKAIQNNQVVLRNTAFGQAIVQAIGVQREQAVCLETSASVQTSGSEALKSLDSTQVSAWLEALGDA